MRETLLALFELSQIDTRVLELEKSGELVAKQIKELEKISDPLRLELGAHRVEYETRLREQNELEAQIRDKTGEQTKWKRRLNDIKSPREYQALSREVEQAERQVRTGEEAVLKMIGELEEKKKLMADLEERLNAKDLEARSEIVALRERQRSIDDQARASATGRPQVVGRLAANLVTRYEQIRKRRGVAVALTDGKCSGCNFIVRPQQMVEIRRLDSLIDCPRCGRILVLSALIEGQRATQEAHG